MFDLAWSTVKARRGGFIAAFVALFFGATVITASGVLLESGLRSGVAAERYAAASVMLGGKQHLETAGPMSPSFAERVSLPADVAAEVAKVAGVASVVPERSVEVNLVTGQGEIRSGDVPLYAHGWSSAGLAPFTLTAGTWPRAPGDVVLDAGLAAATGLSIEDSVRITAGSEGAGYRLVGTASAPSLHRQSAAFFTDETASALSGTPDRITALGVLAAPGVDAGDLAGRITAALPGVPLAAYTGQDLGDIEFLDVGQARGFLTALSGSLMGTVAMIVLFVVASTLGLSIQQRRRELAMLRAIAATPRQIHRMIGAEMLLVSVAGGVLGCLPGFAAAGLLRDAFAGTGVLPSDFALTYSPLPGVAAALLCVLSGWGAGYFAVRRFANANPVDALGEAAVEPAEIGKTRLVSGFALVIAGLGAGTVLPLVIPGEAALVSAASSVLLLMIGAAMLGPYLVRAVTGLVAPVLTLGRVSGYLAVANMKANSRRLSGAVVPLALAIAMASVQLFSLTTAEAAAADEARTGMTADFVLASGGTGLSPAVADAVREVPGVASAMPVVRSQVVLTYTTFGDPQAESFAAQGIEAGQLGGNLDLAVSSGSLAELRGDTVALSESLAGTTGADVGDTVDVHLGDGVAQQLRLVAVYGRGLGFGDVTLPHDLLAAHTTDRLDDSVLVSAAGGTDLGALGVALRGLSATHPGLAVLDRSAFTAAQDEQRGQQSSTNLIGNGLLLLYLVIAVVNTLVMATGARSREFAMLRLIGTGRRHVRRMMTLEAGIVVVAATLIGAAASAVPLIGISLATTGRVLPAVDPVPAGAIVLAAAVIGFSSIVLSTRSSLRGRPVDAVGSGA
jgi:putative ABC transport system permease protein